MKYIKNNYFSDRVLRVDLKKYFDDDKNCQTAFDYIKNLYYKNNLEKLNESQLEENFIKPILNDIFEYKYLTQEKITIYGQQLKPDYILFPNEKAKKNYIDKKDYKDILLIFEAKEWARELDTKTIAQSPHMQLVRYNMFIGVRYGILSNGKEWRLYDLKDKKSEKIFFSIDLEDIIKNDDYEFFQYFYYIFRKKYFIAEEKEIESKADKISIINEMAINEIEEDLKNIIYGDNSIIEKIGQILYRNYNDRSLNELFNQSIIMAYRLLFISYFETKYESQLFYEHDNYKIKALFTLYKNLEKHFSGAKVNPKLNAYKELCDLFNILDEGSVPFNIPLLNGGLFEKNKAPLLHNEKLFTNEEVFDILKELLQIRDDKNKINIRNFAIMSVTHIGNIYEGLLQYNFRKAGNDKTYYLEYRDDTNKSKNGYYDIHDYQLMKKNKNIKIDIEKEIEPNSIYLVNNSNERKMSASYYTPASISNFIVKDAVNIILNEKKYKENILSLKVLDNACGSGHFLVDFLDALTENIYSRIFNGEKKEGDFYYLYDFIIKEKDKIKENLKKYNLDDLEIDELQILKRILLKKIIYGVDINYFSVELTRLSLWLKTFIFGTPLSFIEHHIKEGNSLIGSSIEEGNKIFSESEKSDEFFKTNFKEIFDDLKNISEKLSSLPDSTTEEIENSKKIYSEEIYPKQKRLSQILDLITYKKLSASLKKKKETEILSLDTYGIFTNIENYIDLENEDALLEVGRIKNKYKFFHYDIEFPESYNYGFDIIIGNPPWDKVKLDDKDFFSKYRSNYRTMKNSEKKATQDNLLKYSKEIKEEYLNTGIYINTLSSYYNKYYPLNEGAGDTNLYKLFMERNINLLSQKGSLIYITPSTWSYEEGSINLRKYIFDNIKFKYFYQFENRNKIFRDVDSRYKFAIWSLQKLNPDKSKADFDKLPCFFMELETDRLYNEKIKDIFYSLNFSRNLFSDTYMIPEIRDKNDLKILQKTYSVGKTIDANYIDFFRELDLTNDKDIFLEDRNNNEMFLYQGRMINQFNSSFEKPQYFVDENELKKRILSKEIYRMIQNIYEEKNINNLKRNNKSKEATILEYFNFDKREDLEKYIVYDYNFPRLAFRGVARNNDSRTLISAILPPNSTAGNSLYLSYSKKYYLENKDIKIKRIPFERLLWVNAIFNSIIIDYIIRLYVDMAVNKIYLMKIPLIHASEEELKKNPYNEIIENAFVLNLYNNKELKSLYKTSVEIPKNDKDYNMIQIRNDILIAKLYNITFEEFARIVDSFKVLKNKYPEYTNTLIDKARSEL